MRAWILAVSISACTARVGFESLPGGDSHLADGGGNSGGDGLAGGDSAGDDPGDLGAGSWMSPGGAELAPRSTRLTGSMILGGASQTAARTRSPVAASLANDEVLVVWVQGVEPIGSELVAMQVRGRAYRDDAADPVSFGDPAIAAGSGSEFNLRLDSNRNPVVAWKNQADRILVKSYTGSSWSGFAGSDVGGGLGSIALGTPALALDGLDRPVVAWFERIGAWGIEVRRWDGSTWQDLGSVPGVDINGLSNSQRPGLAVSGTDVYVAWGDRAPAFTQVYLRVHSGAWQELSGSATGNGVSNTPDSALNPEVILGAAGQPVVVWQQVTGFMDRQLYAKELNGGAWIELDGSATGDGLGAGGINGNGHTVALSPTGDIAVTWFESIGTNQESEPLHVRLFNGSTWSDPANDDPRAYSFRPTLAWDTSGRLVATWAGGNFPDRNTFAGRLDGGQWQSLGPAVSPGGGLSASMAESVGPDITMDETGQPVVAWVEGDTGIFVERFDGNTWQPLDGSTTGDGIGDGDFVALKARIECDPNTGDLIVVTLEGGFTSVEFQARRFDGTSWSELPTLGLPAGSEFFSMAPGFALDPGGQPVIAHEQDVSDEAFIYVRRLVGATWEEWDGSASGTGISDGPFDIGPVVAVGADGQPVVAWTSIVSMFDDSVVFVRAFNGSTWQELAGSATGRGVSQSSDACFAPALAVDAVGPVLAWICVGADGAALSVARYAGGTWSALGGSIPIGSVDLFEGESQLLVDRSGRLVLAWTDAATGIVEVYARVFDGSDWVELDGSATGGGVSNSAGMSLEPRVASDGARTCVTWVENVESSQVVVRCSE